MHSIRAKITTLTVAVILACVTLIGTISIMTSKSEAEHNATRLLTVVCEAKCDEINESLKAIEQAADTVTRYAYDVIDVVELSDADVIGANGSGRSLRGRTRTTDQQASFDDYFAGFLSELKTVLSSIAENNAGILEYYFCTNPEITQTNRGFWYTRQHSLDFISRDFAQIEDFPADNQEVSWYYTPLDRGMPSWLDPHADASLGSVISYIVPLYRADTFIGVIGIDMAYDTLVGEVNSLEVLDTGYAFLTDQKGKIIYHPTLASGVLLSDVNSKLEETNSVQSSTKLITYSFDGEEKKAAWGTLSNGMKLIVAVPVNDINAGWYRLSRRILLAAVLLLIGFSFVAWVLMGHIVNPLERLADASQRLLKGDYDVDIAYEADDEIGTLAGSFQQMARELRVFIQDLNSKVYRDALTGVRNKGGFDLYVRKIDEMIRKPSPDDDIRFAVIMLDCNDLKTINDTCGHEKGDIYLRTACTIICDTYVHSPVFRIGGDEFVVILQQDSYATREPLERKFANAVNEANERAQHPWDHVSIASGMALFEPDRDPNVESVLRRADERMYQNKKRFKESRG